jgi:hypothetical protein
VLVTTLWASVPRFHAIIPPQPVETDSIWLTQAHTACTYTSRVSPWAIHCSDLVCSSCEEEASDGCFVHSI